MDRRLENFVEGLAKISHWRAHAFRRWIYSGLERGDMRSLRALADKGAQSADTVERLGARGLVAHRDRGLHRVTLKGYFALVVHRFYRG